MGAHVDAYPAKVGAIFTNDPDNNVTAAMGAELMLQRVRQE